MERERIVKRMERWREEAERTIKGRRKKKVDIKIKKEKENEIQKL